MGRGPGFCPRCGERVTPFAAGCALCGADLDPGRHDTPRWELPAIKLRESRVVFVVVLVIVALFMPLLGVIICGAVAYDSDRNDATVERNIALVLAIASFVMFISPSTRFGILQALGLL